MKNKVYMIFCHQIKKKYIIPFLILSEKWYFLIYKDTF